VIQLVQERIESFCFDRRHGSHGCAGLYVFALLVQSRGEIFGGPAVEA